MQEKWAWDGRLVTAASDRQAYLNSSWNFAEQQFITGIDQPHIVCLTQENDESNHRKAYHINVSSHQ